MVVRSLLWSCNAGSDLTHAASLFASSLRIVAAVQAQQAEKDAAAAKLATDAPYTAEQGWWERTFISTLVFVFFFLEVGMDVLPARRSLSPPLVAYQRFIVSMTPTRQPRLASAEGDAADASHGHGHGH